MEIKLKLAAYQEATLLLKRLLIEEFQVSDNYADFLINHPVIGLKSYIDTLVDSCYFLAETNYIDKVYRDSYYSYYSNKLIPYQKNCIKISIFDGEIKLEDFRDSDSIEKLNKQYRGFFVLRPLITALFGRSIISPKALRRNNFSCCTARFLTTSNSVKFTIDGFPHSSQDCETIKCAETTIWALMEYFSTRYQDYKPVLPSNIIKVLNQVSVERQIPSRGLSIQQISYAIREFGFGTRIYSKEEYGSDFERLISCYIESGIPLIFAVANINIGHALICIGHVNINDNQIDHLPISNSLYLRQEYINRSIILYDYDDIDKEFIFIDDNLPSYQNAPLDQPTIQYTDPSFLYCQITHFIVPLYTKIYLEAFEAKRFVLSLLVNPNCALENNTEVVLRFFLTSTRSFKESISLNKGMQADLKKIILSTMMPKFVWVSELSTKALQKQSLAYGLIILDATEASTNTYKPLILAVYQNNYYYFDITNSNLLKNPFILHNFCTFNKNLKTF